MRNRFSTAGPFRERPYYKIHEIEEICSQALKGVGLYPESPSAVRIERFVEAHFHVTPTYDQLPDGIQGFTRFDANGVAEIVISRDLTEQGSKLAERQINSTLAHEAGHGLLQAHLFVLERERLASLFGSDLDSKAPKILCRDAISANGRARSGYDGRWWEFQANQAIGALLLPRPLVYVALEPFLVPNGSLGQRSIDQNRRDEAARSLAEIFDVNPVVVRIRLQELYPESRISQLTL